MVTLNLVTLIRISLKGLYAYKHRSLLSVLGITISIASIISLVSLVEGVKTGLIIQVEKGIGTQQILVAPGKMLNAKEDILDSGLSGVTAYKSTNSTLTEADVEKILRRSKTIENGAPQYECFIKIFSPDKNNTNISVEALLTGTTENYSSSTGYKSVEGRFLDVNDVKQEKKVIVLGHTIKTQLFGQETAVGKILRIKDIDFEVIGVMEDKQSLAFNFNERIYTSVAVMQDLSQIKNASLLIFKANSIEAIAEAEKEIGKALAKFHAAKDFITIKPTEILQLINQIMLLLTALATGVAGISLVTGGVGIINVMLISVKERTKEIGLRKALGATNAQVLYQFLLEAILMSILGSILGILLAFGCLKLISWKIPILTVVIPTWLVIYSFGFAFIIGMVFGIIPAVKATLVKPVEALRYQ